MILDPTGKVIAHAALGVAQTAPIPTPVAAALAAGPGPPASAASGRKRGAYQPSPDGVRRERTAGLGRPLPGPGRHRAPGHARSPPSPSTPTDATLASLLRIELLVSLAVVAALCVLALWTVRRGLRPLEDMTGPPGPSPRATSPGGSSRATRTPRWAGWAPPSTRMLAQIETAFAEKSASEERLRQFVADASHELRTPLTSIRGYAELLRKGAFADEESRDRALGRVEHEAARMGGPGRRPAAAGPPGPGPAARARAGRPAPGLPPTRSTTPGRPSPTGRSSWWPPGPVVVIGDPDRLGQVAHNLVRNALTHTPPGTPGGGERVGADAAWGCWRCATAGPGLEPAQAARVFDRFYRATRPAPARGTGLGLSIVRAIAEALGGRARVTSVPGEGAPSRSRSPWPRRRRRRTSGPRGGPRHRASRPGRSRLEQAGRRPGRGRRGPGASLTVGLGQLGCRGPSRPRCRPRPCRRGRRPVDGGRADADDPVAVAGGVDPADRAGPAAPGRPSRGGRCRPGRPPGGRRRRPGWGGGRPAARGPRASGRPRRPQRALDRRAEVGHRAQPDERGRVGHLELGAARGRATADDRLDHQLVLQAVLGRGEEAGESASSSAPAARREADGAGQRVAASRRPPRRRTSSSGEAPRNRPPRCRGEGEDRAGRAPGRGAARATAGDVDGRGEPGVDAPGQDDLAQPARRRWRPGRRSTGARVAGGGAGPRRAPAADRRRSAATRPRRSAGQPGHLVGQRLGAPARASPATTRVAQHLPVGVAPDGELGHDERAGAPPVEGQGAEGPTTAPGRSPGPVVRAPWPASRGRRRQAAGSASPPGRSSAAAVPRAGQGQSPSATRTPAGPPTPTGSTGPAAAGGDRDGPQGVGLGPHRPRSAGAGQARPGGRDSWLRPPLRRRRPTREPGLEQRSREPGLVGEVGGRAGQVAVGVARRRAAPPSSGHHVLEPEPVAGAQRRPRAGPPPRAGRCARRGGAPGPPRPARPAQVGEVAQARSRRPRPSTTPAASGSWAASHWTSGVPPVGWPRACPS